MKKTILLGITLALAGSAFADMDMGKSRYGGPVYSGAPELNITAALLAGNGPGPFSVARGLGKVMGKEAATKALGKLSKQYSPERVARFVEIFDFAVNDAVKMVMEAKIKVPAPAKLDNMALARKLVKMGMASDGTFYTEFYLDKLLSHKVHMAVMEDIDKKFGLDADKDYHRIANQAYYDFGLYYHVRGVKLAKLH